MAIYRQNTKVPVKSNPQRTEAEWRRAAGGHAQSRRVMHGSYGRAPAGASRRQPLAGASRHAAPDRTGAQAPCSLHFLAAALTVGEGALASESHA
jgi:hypothetical protein